ncbi:MAG: hypothetical protein LBN94_01530 [Puniceicoccales bacterium]|jgi:DNA polymerase-1|nr:hypothetical protein [Puniceicoccales bacterium]
MDKCILVDGLNLMFRCFYGIPFLSNQNFPTNAVFGAIKILWKMIAVEKPTHIAIFFDKGRDPLRQTLLPKYKANRLEMPDPLKIQIPVVKEFAYALGCTVIERSSVEADDLIASFAQKYRDQFQEILIFSADKDFAQCVDGKVHQIIPAKDKDSVGNRLDRQGIYEKFGVYPEQIIDYLALIGDQADNIPGIYGVGPKTATTWLGQFGNIETILSQITAIRPVRFQSILGENVALLRRNQQLVTLNCGIDDIYCEPLQPNEQQYAQLIDFYGLTSLRHSPFPLPALQGDWFSDWEGKV